MAPPDDPPISGKRERSETPPNLEEIIYPSAFRRRRLESWADVDSFSISDSIQKWERRAHIREAQEKAEEQRRLELGQMGRLQEDGCQLQQLIKADPTGMVWLELSRSLDAICRVPDCLFVKEGAFRDQRDYNKPRNSIETDFRIRVQGATGYYNRVSRRNYHYQCFETMVDIPSLIPDRCQLDRSRFENWGLLINRMVQAQVSHQP